jgi:hypothetical protein
MRGTSWRKGQNLLKRIMADNRAVATFSRHLLRPSGQVSTLLGHPAKAQLLNGRPSIAMARRPTTGEHR